MSDSFRDEDLRVVINGYAADIEQKLSVLHPDKLDAIKADLRYLASRAIRDAERLEAVATLADTPKKLRTQRHELTKLARQVRKLLWLYIRYGYLDIRWQSAEVRAKVRRLRARDAKSRLGIIRLNEIAETPIEYSEDKSFHGAYQRFVQSTYRQRRGYSYNLLRSAVTSYVRWTGRDAYRFAKVYATEIVTTVLVLGLLVGAAVDLVKDHWSLVGLGLACTYELAKRLFLDDWLEERFIDRRRRELLASIQEFFFSKVATMLKLNGLLELTEYPQHTSEQEGEELPLAAGQPDAPHPHGHS